ncbi:MAG TPA: hypothetical protein VMV50_03755 [Candidatus Paceibacterota bacterium]|nr:hypothetical protein [Candidatus Paceibacterota bacterium]
MSAKVKYWLQLEGVRKACGREVLVTCDWVVVIARFPDQRLQLTAVGGAARKKAEELKLEPGAELIHFQKIKDLD